jgi:hypothetical protein
MRVQTPASPADVVGVGIAFVCGGLYFVLEWFGAMPLPGEAHAPAVIVLAIGLAFLFAGLTCFVRAKAGMAEQTNKVPSNTPHWSQSSYRSFAIGGAGTLTIIGTWIVIGGGPHIISTTLPFTAMQTTGDIVGRAVFALGAVIVGIYVIAFTVDTIRKLFDRRHG